MLIDRPSKNVLRCGLCWAAMLGLAAWGLAGAGLEDEGFLAMFNGKDLAGWVVEGAATSGKAGNAKPIWSVRDGIIHSTGQGFGFLRYDKKLEDFIFEVEYRLSPKANSGIGIRGPKYAGSRDSRPSIAGYEIQLLDDAGKAPTPYCTGSLYRYVAPRTNAAKPAGQWNHIRVECRGSRIRVTLNGQLLHDLDQTTVAEIKDKPLSGYISLQSHTRTVEFRNPRLKALPR
ncbi:MAG: 3-keto-disaccharide hydrolase [Thermoguttaceae bacterium]